MQQHFGLSCARPVRWLIGAEPAVYAAIASFIEGKGEPLIEVAGPPTVTELADKLKHRNRRPQLPVVRLILKKVTHHLTGEHGIEVKCSDLELEEITRWAREKHLRTLIAGKAMN